jgi:hydrogenase expression/formation protein HypE
MLCVAEPGRAEAILAALRVLPGGGEACRIGTATAEFAGHVVLKTPLGAHRVLTKLSGAQLPRIC